MMKTSHNLFLLLTLLSNLLFFFPASFPHTKCLCQHNQDFDSHHVYAANINYDGNHHIVTAKRHVATDESIQGSGEASGSAQGSVHGSGFLSGGALGNFHRSREIDGSAQGNIHGFRGIGGGGKGLFHGSSEVDGSAQGHLHGARWFGRGGHGGAQGSGDVGGGAQGSGDIGGSAQGSTDIGGGAQGATQSNSQGSTSQASSPRGATSGNANGAAQGSTSTGGGAQGSTGTSVTGTGKTQSSSKTGGAAQGSTQSNSQTGGSAQGNSQGSTEISGSAQGSIQGSADLSGDIGINLKGLFSKVFAFGDSFSAGFDDLVHGQIPGHKSNDHFCISDFLCDSLGLPPLPSFKGNFSSAAKTMFQHGINFATPGASALPKDALQRFSKIGKVAASYLNGSATASFMTQTKWFNEFLSHIGCKQKNTCGQELEKALFWLGGMGIDDHARTAGTSESLQWLKEKSVTHISSMLHDLLQNGAKSIVVQGLPPLGCLLFEVSLSPKQHHNTMGCAIAANAATMIHNKILQKTLQTFREHHPNVKILYGDMWNAFTNVLQNPSKFNFSSKFKACCGTGGTLNFNANALCGANGTTKCSDPSKFIFWDGVHLTAAMNKRLANLVIKQIGPQLKAGA